MAKLTFTGGIHTYDGKELSKDKPIIDILPIGDLVYPLSQHIGAPAVPIVKKGDYVLTGQKREEQAVTDNRFAIYKTDTTIYAGNLEVASAEYGISKESLIQSFQLIVQDWKTGEV